MNTKKIDSLGNLTFAEINKLAYHLSQALNILNADNKDIAQLFADDNENAAYLEFLLMKVNRERMKLENNSL